MDEPHSDDNDSRTISRLLGLCGYKKNLADYSNQNMSVGELRDELLW